MSLDEKYMQRCLQLAANGLGQTYPNPLVGSLIVVDDKIIGEGWHQQAGKPHAEVNAIQSVADEELLKRATLYVNLEPCSHYGKTPPCSNLIIEKKIKKVVIGSVDPNPKVAGKGIVKLQKAGIHVKVGVLENETDELNRRFFTFQQKKRPYVILKWAQTQDGFIAPKQQKTGKPTWITNPYAKQLVHKWRTEEQAILVGKNTAIKDNPMLNARLWQGPNPTRILIDRYLKSADLRLHLYDNNIRTLVFCEEQSKNRDRLIYEKIDFEKPTLPQILDRLAQHNLQSLIVEGGRDTLQNFIDSDLWDEARVFTGQKYFSTGIASPHFDAVPRAKLNINEDVLKTYFKADRL